MYASGLNGAGVKNLAQTTGAAGEVGCSLVIAMFNLVPVAKGCLTVVGTNRSGNSRLMLVVSSVAMIVAPALAVIAKARR